MSKINYLVVILLLCVLAYVIMGQLSEATGTSYELLAFEAIKRIDIKLKKAYMKLKRYPDANKEFETLVLDEFSLYDLKGKVIIRDFKPGSAAMPASFNLIAGTGREKVTIPLEYYGSDFQNHFLYKGRLVKGK
ncbi:MAG: hypothetical protein GY757_60080 [bacterium]|nr:hypothetical protein [bacterium]